MTTTASPARRSEEIASYEMITARREIEKDSRL
jgi:hypothetical protein